MFGSRVRGLSLIEVVVALAIVCLIGALVLPAVQQCREAARKLTCRNQLRQLALAVHAHEAAHQHLPTGGWGWRWNGDPDRGFGAEQPGGWMYNLLPFVELSSIRDQGTGLSFERKAIAIKAAVAVPVPLFTCPSRRGVSSLPFVHPVDFINTDRPSAVVRSDYAACAGDTAFDVSLGRGRGPRSFKEGDSPTYRWLYADLNGVVFRRSTTTFAAIQRGASNTYLLGEKYLCRRDYRTGKAQNDDQDAFVGFDIDTLRTTDPQYPPLADEPAVANEQGFGSAHPGAFSMAMADGAVVSVSYSIERELHRTRGRCRALMR